MEFKMKTEAGKIQTYFIDKNTGIAHKVYGVENFVVK
jgi:hypothetical protein